MPDKVLYLGTVALLNKQNWEKKMLGTDSMLRDASYGLISLSLLMIIIMRIARPVNVRC